MNQPASITAHLLVPTFVGRPDVMLHYRPGGALAEAAPVKMTLTTGFHQGTIPGSAFGDRGVEYYLTTRVGAMNLACPPGAAGGDLDRINTVLTNYDAAGALTTGSRQYRMVSFAAQIDPATVAGVIEDDLGRPDKKVWRFGRWDPGTAGYREYLGSAEDTPPLSPGNAFWLITSEAKQIDFSGLSLEPRSTSLGRGYDIVLKPGWNQVGNPFAFDVDPASIQVTVGEQRYTMAQAVAAGLLESSTLRGYNAASTSYSAATVFKPWTGYFVNNADANQRDMTWTIPYRAMTVGKPLREPLPADEPAPVTPGVSWAATIRATDEAGSERVVELCVSRDASAGLDPADQLSAPRPPGDDFDLFALSPGLPRESNRLSRDVRPAAGLDASGEQWDLLMTRLAGGAIHLYVSVTGSLPGGIVCRLLDVDMGRGLDLGQTCQYELVALPGSDGRRLRLIVGPREYVDFPANGGAPPPASFELQPVLPNPLQGSPAFIRFSLEKDGPASLMVYSVSGRLVHVLADAFLPKGPHIMQWDGRDQNGNAVASGTYFVQLQSGTRKSAQKLVVLR